jgi:hypothetical protein
VLEQDEEVGALVGSATGGDEGLLRFSKRSLGRQEILTVERKNEGL